MIKLTRGRVDEGNERGRDVAWAAGGRKRAEEGLSEEWRGNKGAREGSSMEVS